MEKEQERLQALRVLNEHFKHEGKLGCLEDRQVKLVLDEMIEFRQFGVSGRSEQLKAFLDWRDKQNILVLHDYNNEELVRLYEKSL